MGFPKKNDEMRLYLERKDKTYLLVLQGEEFRTPDGCQEAIGELMMHPDPENPKLCSCSVSPMHLYKKCKRVSWSEMPEVWQDAFRTHYLDQEPAIDPKDVRGLWRVEEFGKG
jgi:hypothetical protein